jgi:hypothetical protein
LWNDTKRGGGEDSWNCEEEGDRHSEYEKRTVEDGGGEEGGKDVTLDGQIYVVDL